MDSNYPCSQPELYGTNLIPYIPLIQPGPMLGGLIKWCPVWALVALDNNSKYPFGMNIFHIVLDPTNVRVWIGG